MSTLLRKSWIHRCNQMLRLVHPPIRAVRFRFLVAAVQDLCQQSSRKSSRYALLKRKMCSTAGLQILVSAMLHTTRDSFKPCLSGLGWCPGNGGKAFRLVPSFPSGAMWCPTTPPQPCTRPRSPRSSARPPPLPPVSPRPPRWSHMNSRLMTSSRMSPCATWGSGWLGGRYRPRSARTGTTPATPAVPSRMQLGICCPMRTLARSAWQIPNCHGARVLRPASFSLCWERTSCNGLVSSAMLAGPR